MDGNTRIDHEAAFQWYVSQGAARSLRETARKFGCNKRTMQKISERHHWQEKLRVIEGEVRERVTEKTKSDLTEVAERHLKLARAIQTRGIQALQKLEFNTAWHASKAIEMAAKLERLVLGEATERNGESVQEATRREVETLLTEETTECADGEQDAEAG